MDQDQQPNRVEEKTEIERPPMDPMVKFLLKFLLPAVIAFGLCMLAFGR